ncbi:MAG TPA: GNAT family N-acetyltransferase [Candidatus Acidoferrales bacterium]|nr:GNAT family N-acetyltransferase [Candidatus Acidoferrales bacterium]
MPLSPPAPLADGHQTEGFASGESALDDWLHRRARGNQARANQAFGASRTYAVCEGNRVVGYYAIASGAIAQTEVSGRFRRNMPDPIPVVVLARLAVDLGYQGCGLGRALFRDAARRIAHAADTIGIRGIVVHAISGKARDFYVALGFDPCPRDAMTLVVTLADVRATLTSL